ncbi:MAG: roadblock/LC7 domain-containing protein, partial [Gemmatimonadota bacterium]|nr:roadblock/LC7 domain-containing protein [Gemmatimonadota bacterium]
ARRLILVVLFDNRTTLGLVRLRMKQAVQELTVVIDSIFSRAREESPSRPHLLKDADAEIDELFNW